MKFTDEQVQVFNLYGYHITSIEKLASIKKQGLLPQCGKRCQQVGDIINAIYFFPALSLVEDWVSVLYNKKDIPYLNLLRFSLKDIDFYIQSSECGDCYTLESIPPTKIEILKQYNSLTNSMFLLNNLLVQGTNNLTWQNLNNNKIYTKTK